MKKLPLFAGAMLVTLLAAVLAVPYWMGGKIEEAFRDRLATLADHGGLVVSEERFERGWLSSRAHTVLRAPGVPIELDANHVIHHGPLALDRWLAGELALEPVQAHI